MATLVLSTLGTLVGGPLGGALGAMVGREIDGRVFGPRQEGPRLKDLKVTGSSYGDPVARHYGRVRAPGTIIWATDLKEKSRKSGGGKGQPKTRTYSYSISFAVALASAPIDRVGRIWADGNLLRGAAGDLKTQGKLRVHTGRADQRPDPLMAAALGSRCPAYRDLAYAVFEDLELGDFENRIPTLSFELFAGSASDIVKAMAVEAGGEALGAAVFPELIGFSHETGTLGQVLTLVDRLHPLAATLEDGRLVLATEGGRGLAPVALPPAAAWAEGEFGREQGLSQQRQGETGRTPAMLRYYDEGRDYQPGLQRPDGRADQSGGVSFEFPGVLSAAGARTLVNRARMREAVRRDTLSWRMTQLDPRISPGALVTVPGHAGPWQVESWEWRSGGIELGLKRDFDRPLPDPAADQGTGWAPPDRTARRTVLKAFELPFDGHGSSGARQVFVAATAEAGLWPGAALYRQEGTALVPVAEAPSVRAAIGKLTRVLGPSRALRFEAAAELHVALIDHEADLSPASIAALASGANRALVGREIVQFAEAEALGDGRWVLRGLLRGRGGTEGEARNVHPEGRDFVLLDDRLVALDQAVVSAAGDGAIAAIGLADEEPVIAPLDNARATLKPPCPVHPRLSLGEDGSRTFAWTRRARGGWAWLDEVEQPLVEDTERYEIGVGPAHSPAQLWPCDRPARLFTASEWSALRELHPGAALWVRQCGRYAKSDAVLLATFP